MASGVNRASLLEGAILLAADNFAPLHRTPWAGTRLGEGIKKDQCGGQIHRAIGESWEFSCDPAFPSALYVDGKKSSLSLAEVLPEAQLLIKLLNAAEPLSLQVHPRDNDAHLGPDECGKPEAWLILEATRGAGIYMGFSKALTREQLKEQLAQGKDISSLLNFVAVKENDYFEIAPGTPHAIGPGVVLLETQRVLPGKSGKTYRLWDWNRRYDHEGKASVNGKARELHLEAALPLVDPLHQVGEAYVASLRRSFKQEMVSSKVSLKRYPPNFYSQVLRGTSEAEGKFLLENSSAYLCIIALQGALEIESRHKKKATLNQGWPALLPGGAGPYRCQGKGDFIIVAPAEGAISLRN